MAKFQGNLLRFWTTSLNSQASSLLDRFDHFDVLGSRPSSKLHQLKPAQSHQVMTVPATVPPRVGASVGSAQPCAVGYVSRSSRRRARMRRVAIQNSIRQTAELKHLMRSSSSDASTDDLGPTGLEDGVAHSFLYSTLRPEAKEFKSEHEFVVVDWSSMQFQVKELSERRLCLTSSILGDVEPGCVRRDLPELMTAEGLPGIQHCISHPSSLTPPARKTPKITECAGVLQHVGTPRLDTVHVVADRQYGVATPRVCGRRPGHKNCIHCYFVDGRFARH